MEAYINFELDGRFGYIRSSKDLYKGSHRTSPGIINVTTIVKCSNYWVVRRMVMQAAAGSSIWRLYLTARRNPIIGSSPIHPAFLNRRSIKYLCGFANRVRIE